MQRRLATSLNILMGHHRLHQATKRLLVSKMVGTKSNDGNKRIKKRRKRARRTKTLQPLILQHSPSRDIKHFICGSPISKRNHATSSPPYHTQQE